MGNVHGSKSTGMIMTTSRASKSGWEKLMVDVDKARNHLLAMYHDMIERGQYTYAEHILYVLRTTLAS